MFGFLNPISRISILAPLLCKSEAAGVVGLTSRDLLVDVVRSTVSSLEHFGYRPATVECGPMD